MRDCFGDPSLVLTKFLFHLHSMQRPPNYVTNAAINNIFQGNWQHECISCLNVVDTPEHARVPYCGRPQPYPSMDERVEHACLSVEVRHNRRVFWEGLTGIDQLWVHTIIAHHSLLGRGREGVLLDPDMFRLLEMGLYNLWDSRDVPSHMLSHTFHYAASLGVGQLAMFDSLAATMVSCHNATIKDIEHLKEDGTKYLTHL
jgi:hypothetical protein